MLAKSPHRATLETLILTPAEVNEWRIPEFQRPLRVNTKVLAMAEELKDNGGIISGFITLGKVLNQRTIYIVDGQHRIEGFKISELPECIADVRTIVFPSMAEMSAEFVRLNSALVKLNPDDILRGLEGTHEPLKYIRAQCPFVGYDHIRRSTATPIVSMSALIRSWSSASKETPGHGGVGGVAQLVASLEMDDAKRLVSFLVIAESAWGRDPEYWRLWGALNITLCMWLYRRTVLAKADTGKSLKRSDYFTVDQFRKGLTALSADTKYVEWLVGRNLTDRDRSPGYLRIKAAFTKRLEAEGKQPRFPRPAWAIGGRGLGTKSVGA